MVKCLPDLRAVLCNCVTAKQFTEVMLQLAGEAVGEECSQCVSSAECARAARRSECFVSPFLVELTSVLYFAKH